MRVFLMSSLALALGCGSGAPFPSFMGTWMVGASSMVQAACPPPLGASSTPLTGNIQIAAAVGADLVTLDLLGCDILYKVSGATATGTGNLTCTHPAKTAGVIETDTYSSITLMTADGRTMTESAAGTADFTNTAGTLRCTFTTTASLTKVSND